MKVSKSLIAAAVIAVLPLAAVAGDQAKAPAPLGTVSSAQFDTLDANHDSRISRTEAATDAKLVFASVDTNGDGYLDSDEFAHRSMSKDPVKDAAKPGY